MKRLAILALLLMLTIPVLPVALADDTANVDIGIAADTVNLNVTSTISKSGTLRIFVNGTEVKEVTVYETYQWNYDSDILFLKQWINGVEYSLFSLANYTDGKLSMLLVNDNCLVKWIGCLDNTTLIGKRIFDGNSTVVMELDRLTNDDATLLDMITRLTIVVQQTDSRLVVETLERKKVEEEIRGLVEKLKSESATKLELEATLKNLMIVQKDLADTEVLLEQTRIVLITIGAIVVLLVIAQVVVYKKLKGKDQGLAAVR